MAPWLTAELVFAVLVALCGFLVLTGAMWLLGRGGERSHGGGKRDPDRNGRT